MICSLRLIYRTYVSMSLDARSFSPFDSASFSSQSSRRSVPPPSGLDSIQTPQGIFSYVPLSSMPLAIKKRCETRSTPFALARPRPPHEDPQEHQWFYCDAPELLNELESTIVEELKGVVVGRKWFT
jgi:hypothetical protein